MTAPRSLTTLGQVLQYIIRTYVQVHLKDSYRHTKAFQDAKALSDTIAELPEFSEHTLLALPAYTVASTFRPMLHCPAWEAAAKRPMKERILAAARWAVAEFGVSAEIKQLDAERRKVLDSYSAVRDVQYGITDYTGPTTDLPQVVQDYLHTLTAAKVAIEQERAILKKRAEELTARIDELLSSTTHA